VRVSTREPDQNFFFLSRGDARSTRTWSGIPYYLSQSLDAHFGTPIHLGPMPNWPTELLKAEDKVRRFLRLKKSLPGHSRHLPAVYRRVVQRRLAAHPGPAELIFSPVGSVLLPRLRSNLPVVYTSDATTQLMLDYYPRFSNLSARAVRAANAMERDSIARADLLLYPTHWAAESAIRDYGADPAKVRVIPYGANLTEVPDAPPAYQPQGERCRLLMVGVDWEIKGGAIAVETLRALRALGVEAELTIVGCSAPSPINLPGLRFIPFLDKNKAGDRARLNALYREASFFLLPTRSECYGIVFCEAAAFGLPAITAATGGVPEVVQDGRTRCTLPLSEGGEAYAARIAALWSDQDRYRAMRAESRRVFETRLNWDAWGRTAAQVMTALLPGRANAAPAHIQAA
jgi:glycosyltransferase involved in cell wall biosynthesis